MGKGPDWGPRKNARKVHERTALNPGRVRSEVIDVRLTRQANEDRAARSEYIRTLAFLLQNLADRGKSDIPYGVFVAQAVKLHDKPELRKKLINQLTKDTKT